MIGNYLNPSHLGATCKVQGARQAEMAFWWVNQNQTGKYEIAGGFMWSPSEIEMEALIASTRICASSTRATLWCLARMEGETVDNSDEIRKEIAAIAAENLALQFVLTCLVQRIGEVEPALEKPMLQAYDDAANHAEKLSLLGGKQSGHLPETLRIIEAMRSMLAGRNKPQREV